MPEVESSKSTILEVSCQLITGVGAGGWFFTVMTILAGVIAGEKEFLRCILFPAMSPHCDEHWLG